MPARPKNRGLVFLRRSSGRQETSLQVQLEWAIKRAAADGVRLDAQLGDLAEMQARGLHSYKDIRLDDAITGANLERPGLVSLKTDVIKDKTISDIYSHRRDRLGRPEDAQLMVMWEKEIRQQGVTFVMSDKVGKPLERGVVDIGEEISMWFDYFESGEFLRKLAERVLASKILLGKGGYWTGGRAPYGFVRVLVDAAGNVLEELREGKKVRQQGCHVRIMPKDLDKLAVWVMMLDLKHQGWGGRQIANHLNALGIPSPDAGRMRKDQGVKHYVSGKWNQRTVLELCRNPAIVGQVQLGRRSDGAHRRISKDAPRILTEHDRDEHDKPRLVHNDRSEVIVGETGFDSKYDVQKWQDVSAQMDRRGESQRGIRRAKDPSRYPLACRIIDLTDRCGSIMYGRPNGERRMYSCGRYMRTRECSNNTVDADAMYRSTIDDLKRAALLAVGRNGVRARLEKLAERTVDAKAVTQNEQARKLLESKKLQLEADLENIERRMGRERDDDLYEVLRGQRRQAQADLQDAESRLATFRTANTKQLSAADEVEAALQLFDDIKALADDEAGRLKFIELAERMKLRVGLWFGSAIKGKKREVRRLLGGVTKLGDEELPVPVHGDRRIDGPLPVSEHLTTGEAGGEENDHCPQVGVVTVSEKESEAAPPGLSVSRQEGISYTMVSRGDRI